MGTLEPVVQQFIGWVGVTCALGLLPILLTTLFVWQFHLWDWPERSGGGRD